MTYYEKKIKEWATLLQKRSFDQVLIYLTDLKKTAHIDEQLFTYLVNSDVILQELYQQRVKLAIIASRPAKAMVLPEDRSRIALTLAQCAKHSFEEANVILAKEFGPNFQLQEKYKVGDRSLTWTQIVQKAKELRTGIYNNCYVQMQPIVSEIMAYYKTFKVTDQDQVLQILNLTQELKDSLKTQSLQNAGTKESEVIIAKTKELYHAVGRLQLEMDELDIDPDLVEIQEYVFYMNFVCIARAAAINQRVSPSDWGFARKFLTRVLGQAKFMSLQDTEEMLRLHQPLAPNQSK